MAGALAACLDVPHEPSSYRRVSSIEVHTIQNGVEDSTLLKVNPNDSVQFVAVVKPKAAKDELAYYWYNDGELIDSGRTLTVNPRFALNIPEILVVKDKGENEREIEIHIVMNSPPELSQKTTPADGDTLFATSTSPVTFRWIATDEDSDDLNNVLIIDGTRYPVGELNEVQQSGFKPGEHTFEIIVTDPYGDADTLPERTFYTIDTLEAEND